MRFKRKRMRKRSSKKYFSRTASKSNRRNNVGTMPLRGGYRL